MSKMADLAQTLEQRFKGLIQSCDVAVGEITMVVAPQRLTEVCLALRDDDGFRFELLVDVSGVEYLEYGAETNSGPVAGSRDGSRFAVVYHLLSVSLNQRVRLKVPVDGEPPVVDSVVDIWSSANWFEREAFDLFGIAFEGHPDLRRILTDYGFIGHPFRKDFPISGNVEMRYDPEQARVVYEPVSIDPRMGTTRVIREDFRYGSGDPSSDQPGDSGAGDAGKGSPNA